MTHAKFDFNWLMLTLIFGIWASEPPRAWRTTEKAGPDRVKCVPVFLSKLQFTSVSRTNLKERNLTTLLSAISYLVLKQEPRKNWLNHPEIRMI